MKVYTSNASHYQFLQENLPETITLTDKKEEANYYVAGRFSEEDYHENLQGIIIPFTGHNGIDLDALRRHNLKLFNTTVHSVYVAEMALRLTLGILGNLPLYHENMRKTRWSNRNNDERIPWISLLDKKVGIYGFGRIGRHLKAMLSPLTNQVYTIDRGKDYGDALLVDSLEALCEISDIVIVAAPLNETTENAFDDNILKTMHGKFLINVGRGAIINQAALYHRLKDGTLKGFASDVWYNYPKDTQYQAPADYPIHTLENVLMTPHCGGFAEESPRKIQQKVLDHLLNINAGDFSEMLDTSKLK